MNSPCAYDVIIPIYRPDGMLYRIIKALNAQTVTPASIILMESLDGGAEGAFVLPESECPIIKISFPVEEFDHAATRHKAVGYSDSPYFVCLTQDAVPAGPEVMEELLRPLVEGTADVSYGRQMPSKEALNAEKITRYFNYPPESAVKDKGDIPRLGIKAFFCSNACAAYDRRVYDRLGGFAPPAIFNEDMVFASSLIRDGGRIAYASGARVVHSHNYNLSEDLKRSFDLGVSQAMHPEVFADIPSESEGLKYLLYVCRKLWEKGSPGEIPAFVVHSGTRFLGYRLGRRYSHIPLEGRRCLSMNPGFWK